jgi:AraC-like DNA-binding protein
LARLLGFSLRQVQRHFLYAGDATIHAWLFELRMRDAAMLMGSRLRVNEVGNLLGYKSASHFCRDFRKRHRASPSAFRLRRAEPLAGQCFLAQYAELLEEWNARHFHPRQRISTRVPGVYPALRV